MTRTQSDTTNKKRSLSQLRSFYFAFTPHVTHQTTQPIQTTPPNHPAQYLPYRRSLPISYALSITPLYFAVYRFDPTNSPTALHRPQKAQRRNRTGGEELPGWADKTESVKVKKYPLCFPQKCTIIIYYSAIPFPFIAHFALQKEYKRKGN